MAEKTNNHVCAVSIGMPIYNGEKYIKEALNSVLTQTFEDFELIISDNCSTDSTPIICKGYASKDSRIRYIRQDANIGANANFKFLLQQATGEFFMWLACDDCLESKNYLVDMISTMQRGHDFCFPNVKLLIENAEKKAISDGIMDRFTSCESKYDYCKQTVFICSFQVYGLFRRDFLIESYKYIDQCKHLRCYGEGLFVHVITANSSLAYVPTASLVYRRHGDNISSTQKTNYLMIDFTKFTFMLLSFYAAHQKFTLVQKIMLFKSIIYVHGRHFLGIIVKYLLSIIKNFNLKKSS